MAEYRIYFRESVEIVCSIQDKGLTVWMARGGHQMLPEQKSLTNVPIT